jgi:hypothetical protein
VISTYVRTILPESTNTQGEAQRKMSLFTSLLRKSLKQFLHKRKRWLIAIAIVTVVLAGINHFLGQYVNNFVGTSIKNLVAKESKGFYSVDFKDLRYILNEGRFLLTQFTLEAPNTDANQISADSTKRAYVYSASIPELHIDIVDFWSILVHKKLKIIGVDVRSPEISISKLRAAGGQQRISLEASSLYKMVSTYLSELKINSFAMYDAAFDFETLQGPDYNNFHVKNLTFKLENFQVNEQSEERSDKIFYTDNIILEIKNQDLLLKDSMHHVSFGRFYLSTISNELAFENLKLTRRKNLPTSKAEGDDYTVNLPLLKLTGVDFMRAYNDNFLLIDSLLIEKPSIDLTKRTAHKTSIGQRNRLLELSLLYHDYLEVGQFRLDDAQIQYTDATKTPAKSYRVNNFSTQISKLEIDSGRHSVRKYGFDFGKIDLLVKDFSMNMPDSTATLGFDEFMVSSEPFALSVSNLALTPTKGSKKSSNSQISANIPFLVITGLDLPAALNSDSLSIRELFIETPSLEIVKGFKTAIKMQSKDSISLMQKLQEANSYFKYVCLERFLLTQGSFKLMSSTVPSSPDVAVNNIKIDLEKIHFDKSTNDIRELLQGSQLELSTGHVSLSTSSVDLKVKNTSFSGASERLVIDSVLMKKAGGQPGLALDIDIPMMTASGLDPNQIMAWSDIQLDTLQLNHSTISLEEPATAKNLKPPTASSAAPFPKVSIKHLLGKGNFLEFKNPTIPLFRAKDIEFNIAGLTLDQALSDNVRNQFDYDGIHNITVKGYNLILDEQQHLISADQIQWSNDSSFSIKNIILAPFGKPSNQYRIAVPGIQINKVDLKRILKDSYYHGKELIIDRPLIDLRLAEGEQTKLTSLDLGFIPLLLRNKFLGAESKLFKLKEGVLNFRQKTDGDSLIFQCDDLNIEIDHFAVDSTTEMRPERFLFANDVLLYGDYFTAYNQNNDHFFNINHFYVSTKEQDLKFDGLYYSSKPNGKTSAASTKVTIDFLYLLDLDFYKLTQQRSLNLAEINIDNAELTITPAPTKPAIGSIPNVPLRPTSDPKSAQLTKRVGSGLNIHKKKYPFDTMLLKQIAIDRIFLTENKLNLQNPDERRSDLVIPDIWLMAENIRYDPIAATDSSRFLYTDNIRTKIKNFSYVLPDNLAAIKFSELDFNSTDSTMKIKNFALQPRISKFDYGFARGYQSTWLRIDNNDVSIAGIDLLRTINERHFSARSIDVNTINFEIYRDKRIPFPEWQRRPLPQVELHALDFGVTIDTVQLDNGYIGYQEHVEKSSTPGEIFFTNLNATITNVSNDSIRLKQWPKTNISATTKVFGKGRIVAEFQFDMLDPYNIHTYGVEVNAFDMREFNRILIPNAFAQVKSGQNESILMTAKANEDYSFGEMRFHYSDLKVQLLDPDTETPKGLGHILGSFFANTFIIRTNNPKNFVVRKGYIFFERDKKRAIFNYWTKTFLSGVVSSIGATNNKKKIRKMQEATLQGNKGTNLEN